MFQTVTAVLTLGFASACVANFAAAGNGEWRPFGRCCIAVYDFDTVLVAITIQLPGKARLGKKLGCKPENISKTYSKHIETSPGEGWRRIENRIKIVSKSYQNRIQTVSTS